MSHTKEPWVVVQGGKFDPEVIVTTEDRIDSHRGEICSMDVEFTGPHGVEQKANARRIVACVNACAGSSTEWLEFSVSEDCADLSGPFEPLETRITSILKAGLEYMCQRDQAWSELREIRSAINADAEEATSDEVQRVIAQRDELLVALVKAADFIQPYNAARDLLDELDAAIASMKG